MSDALIIDGKSIAEEYLQKTADEVASLAVKPCLAMVLVGDNPASHIYVRNKKKKAEALGIESVVYEMPVSTPENELLSLLQKLNEDEKVNAILVQLPLPEHIDEFKVISSISPLKDVDGFTPENIGKLALRKDCLVPCTPLGCMKLIHKVSRDIAGMRAVVVGRSNIVGRPLAQLLLNENCTVTVAHSYTKDLADITKEADILAVAVGKPSLIRKEHIKKGAIVLDVGINYQPDKTIKGDVAFAEVLPLVRAITPVPKGVGPMTIAMLLANTLKAFKNQQA